MEAKVIIATIIYAVPGFVASMILDFLLVRRMRGQIERIKESVLLTVLAYTAASVIPDRWFNLSLYAERLFPQQAVTAAATTQALTPIRENLPFLQESFWTDFGVILLLGSAIGMLIGVVVRLPKVKQVWMRMFGRSFYTRVWDSLFDNDLAQYLVQVELKDGERWLGVVAKASDYPGERELLLSSVARIGADGVAHGSVAKYMLVDAANIQKLFLIPRPDTGIPSGAGNTSKIK